MGQLNRLSARAVETLKTPGRYADGGGLYLVVGRGAARSWLMLITVGGRRREIGLGSLRGVPLVEARKRAAAVRVAVAAGRDPIAEKRAKRRVHGAFGPFAIEMIAKWAPSWRNPKHTAQWEASLRRHAGAIWSTPLAAIDTAVVLRVLQPVWTTAPETAARVRGRIEKILDAARVAGLRDGENPARWRGHLDKLLSARPQHTRGHHAAIAFDHVPAFMTKLDQSTAGDALAFSILTAARPGEALAARWSEIDLDKAVWTLPAVRMKGGRAHRVPLSVPAVAILRRRRALAQNDLVFPSRRPDRPLNNTTTLRLMRTLGIEEATPHGFRSSFRDWIGEKTAFPNEVAEMALAHAITSKVEAAYRRGDLFERRRELMDRWGGFCMRHGGRHRDRLAPAGLSRPRGSGCNPRRRVPRARADCR